MKPIVAVFVLCFAGAYAKKGIIENNDSGVEVNEACLVEYGINPDLIYNPGDEVLALTNDQLACVGACIYRDYGIMRPDGTIDLDKAETYFGEDDSQERDIFFAVYNACEKEVACSLVKCMFAELKNHWAGLLDNTNNEEDIFEGFRLAKLL